MEDRKLKFLTAQTNALKHIQNEKNKLNNYIIELKNDYLFADEPMKKEIEIMAQEALNKLNVILIKLKEM